MKYLYILILIFITNLTYAQINGAHDFTTSSWNLDNGCKPCHVPETNELRTIPLWSSNTNIMTINISDVSKLCLSCHEEIDASQSNMRNHPVSIDYSSFYNDYNSDIEPLKLFNGKVECSTCHDPHNENNIPKMLRISNNNSALCLTCHNK